MPFGVVIFGISTKDFEGILSRSGVRLTRAWLMYLLLLLLFLFLGLSKGVELNAGRTGNGRLHVPLRVVIFGVSAEDLKGIFGRSRVRLARARLVDLFLILCIVFLFFFGLNLCSSVELDRGRTRHSWLGVPFGVVVLGIGAKNLKGIFSRCRVRLTRAWLMQFLFIIFFGVFDETNTVDDGGEKH